MSRYEANKKYIINLKSTCVSHLEVHYSSLFLHPQIPKLQMMRTYNIR